ncbi:unnamed protein product [Dibothriocephalus latus]|uniref:Cadherin domain-containing protein n=1 Tax=Dibothriocephalus latus TaxID=60516 RepID=A0A3P7NMY7_DIBLA|nr:unnamed protein product [Dibothriocephalus latus]
MNMANQLKKVRVFDPDSPEVNGVVRCAEPRDVERRQALTFVPDLLTNPSAGVYDLRTRVVLDREGPQVEDGKEFIRLICWDGNQQSEAARQYGRSPSFTATMTATLTIRDINDNAPIFSRSIYHIETPENNLLGAKIFQVSAHDADSGANSEIIYSLLDHANFRVDPVSGWITASVEFDREKRDSYQVSVFLLRTIVLFELIKMNIKGRPRKCYDRRTHGLQIEIPALMFRSWQAMMLTTCSTESLQDKNITIPALGPMVGIIEIDGRIITANEVTIVASDKGEPRRSSSVLLNLTITDVNDNVPFLLPCGEANMDGSSDKSLPSLRRGNTFTVLENAPVGTFVGQLMAEDADSGRNGEITFRLLRRHGLAAAARFELLANGSMFTVLPLDREETVSPL